MGIPGESAPTRQNIKSHLQKYRIFMKKRTGPVLAAMLSHAGSPQLESLHAGQQLAVAQLVMPVGLNHARPQEEEPQHAKHLAVGFGAGGGGWDACGSAAQRGNQLCVQALHLIPSYSTAFHPSPLHPLPARLIACLNLTCLKPHLPKWGLNLTCFTSRVKV